MNEILYKIMLTYANMSEILYKIANDVSDNQLSGKAQVFLLCSQTKLGKNKYFTELFFHIIWRCCTYDKIWCFILFDFLKVMSCFFKTITEILLHYIHVYLIKILLFLFISSSSSYRYIQRMTVASTYQGKHKSQHSHFQTCSIFIL